MRGSIKNSAGCVCVDINGVCSTGDTDAAKGIKGRVVGGVVGNVNEFTSSLTIFNDDGDGGGESEEATTVVAIEEEDDASDAATNVSMVRRGDDGGECIEFVESVAGRSDKEEIHACFKVLIVRLMEKSSVSILESKENAMFKGTMISPSAW